MRNNIDPTAIIPKNVKMGSFNHIGKNVVITSTNNEISIGDNNIINDNVRIIVSNGKLEIGDWNVIHNDTLIISGKFVTIKNNVWVGQNSVLDGLGGLTIKNGVRIGMQSQIWSHAKTGEEIEGCMLNIAQPTTLEDEVWIQGNCLIGSGVTIGYRAIGLLGSVLFQNVNPNTIFKGNPAMEVKGLRMYKKISEKKKIELMLEWANEFKDKHENELEIVTYSTQIELKLNSERLIISINPPDKIIKDCTYFILSNKKFIKTNSLLERTFYSYLYSNKARFNPN
jgi:acetyltransferase-like isoleucine patch superfamily enzyme